MREHITKGIPSSNLMALNQKTVKEKLDVWARLQERIGKAHAKRNRELDPHLRTHQDAIAPIVAKYDLLLDPLLRESTALHKEIETLLLANTSADGKPKVAAVAGDAATAQLMVSEGARIVDVQKFFATVKTKGESFWNSLKVVIKDAEKLVGKEKIDEISEKKSAYSVAIALIQTSSK